MQKSIKSFFSSPKPKKDETPTSKNAIEDEVKDERSPLKQNNGSPTKDSPVKATRKGRRCRVIESDDEEEGTKETEQENQSNSTDPVKVNGVEDKKTKSDEVEMIESPAKSPFGLPIRKTARKSMTTPNNKKKSLSFSPQSESPAKKIKLEKEEEPVSNEKSNKNTEADEEKVEVKRETVEEDMEMEEAEETKTTPKSTKKSAKNQKKKKEEKSPSTKQNDASEEKKSSKTTKDTAEKKPQKTFHSFFAPKTEPKVEDTSSEDKKSSDDKR